nr:hypothetical protein [Candidatus Freyarchaeota archaeon]
MQTSSETPLRCGGKYVLLFTSLRAKIRKRSPIQIEQCQSGNTELKIETLQAYSKLKLFLKKGKSND